MTCHLPHAGHSDVKYDAALSCIEEAIGDARRRGLYVLIGSDANAIVGQQSDHDSKRIIGKWGLHSRNDRGIMFAAWLHMTRLAASNTMFQKPFSGQWTHQSWSTGSQRQIDYVLVDNRLRGLLIDAGACDDIDFLSDHRSVYAALVIRDSDGYKKPRRQRNRNTNDFIGDKFHCELDSLISESPRDAQGLAEGIVTAARASCTGLVPESGDGRSRGLRELLAVRKAALNPETRKLLTKEI